MTYRLLKITAQVWLVDDDGENLREVMAEPVVIAPADLWGWPAKVRADIAALNQPEADAEAAVDEDDAVDVDG